MKKFIYLSLVICILFITSCEVDPNEPDSPDGKDFGLSDVTYQDGNLITDVYFWSDFNADEFFYYFDNNNDGAADFLVRCEVGTFEVLKASMLGFFNILKYTGTPTINGSIYHLEFPLDALEPDWNPDFITEYWFYLMESKDRMPDIGYEKFIIIG